MARSRRALLRKGNVTNIADAREKRKQKHIEHEKALANARLSSLEDATQEHVALSSNAQAVSGSDASAPTGCGAPVQSGATPQNPVMQRASGRFSHMNTESLQSSSAAEPKRKKLRAATQSASKGSVASVQPEVAASPVADPAASGEQTAAEQGAQEAKPKKKVSNRTYNREKVEAIKKAIAEGTYKINPHSVADAFIEREAPA